MEDIIDGIDYILSQSPLKHENRMRGLFSFALLCYIFSFALASEIGIEEEEDLSLSPRTFNLTFLSFNSTLFITGTLILGGLLLVSALLYALDVFATSKIDRMLVDIYGPEIYDRFSPVYDDENNGGLTATTFENYYEGDSARRRRRQAEAQNGGKIMGWINLAYAIYNAADESLREPECRKKLVCEVYSRPEEVLGNGYVGKTIQKGMEYLPLIQERYEVASEILEGKKDAEEKRPCTTKSKACDKLQMVLGGLTAQNQELPSDN